MTTPARIATAPALRSRMQDHLRIPLFREGYALVLNSGLTSLFGLAYWLLAARNYSAHAVGLNSAAISAMMFLGGASQLNLTSALLRFLPVSGPGSRRFVRVAYLVAMALGVVFALGFLAGVEHWAPGLGFLASSPAFVLWFAAATVAWGVFNLQDSVLTALRSAAFVPLENLLYSVAKIGLLVALTQTSPRYGVFASWTAGLAFSLIPVNLLIFRRLLPRHRATTRDGQSPPDRGQVARFVSGDYVASLCWLACTGLMPVIVVSVAGASQNAYYSLAWMVALPLFAISANTGTSLVVTAAGDEARLATYARQVLLQTARLVVPGAVVLAVGAPYVLQVFGAAYADHGATTLSLIALSAIPSMVNTLYVSVYRVRRTMRAVVLTIGAEAVLVLGLGVVLLQAMGIEGVGVAWLFGQSVVALGGLVKEPRALLTRPEQ